MDAVALGTNVQHTEQEACLKGKDLSLIAETSLDKLLRKVPWAWLESEIHPKSFSNSLIIISAEINNTLKSVVLEMHFPVSFS